MAVLNQGGPTPRRFACHYNWVTGGTFLFIFGAVLLLGILCIVTVPGPEAKLLGLLIAAASGAIVWAFCSHLIIANPVLTIDERGIWDRRISGAPLPWHAISRVYVKQLTLWYASASVRVELNDPTYFRPPRQGFMRFLPYRPGKVPDLAISHLLLTESADEIAAEILRHRPGIIPYPQSPLDPAFSVKPAMAGGYAGPPEGGSILSQQ